MSKKLWLGLILVLAVAFVGLRPHFTSQPQADLTVAPNDINALTADRRVARYLQQHQRLPDYYISKTQARRHGWVAAKGNLCQVLPGRAIGGDRFANREGGLPAHAGRNWYEADVNYRCGRRGADRLLYSSDGLIYLTTDHYRTFHRLE
ncbi:ribonuclease domain-containing protein [Mixta tenebrionis]|uniref:Ribonuclease n=1 Tax=Mixta tenebrionis TaxID=2562439 RepID=A0A506VBE6_9GAMM|nr:MULTISPECIES: ribonuclease domain-containing protein [Mixta]QHM75466.1 Ribonuclease [Mixta theicola]TPW43354.1 hypothetical protein FKM52_07285 [Mixta tenebrionis]